jgi:hypothetical protein
MCVNGGDRVLFGGVWYCYCLLLLADIVLCWWSMIILMTPRKKFGTTIQIMRQNIQIGRSGSLPALAHYRTTSCTRVRYTDLVACGIFFGCNLIPVRWSVLVLQGVAIVLLCEQYDIHVLWMRSLGEIVNLLYAPTLSGASISATQKHVAFILQNITNILATRR